MPDGSEFQTAGQCGGCNTKTTGCKGSANTRHRQQISVCRAYRTCGSVVIQKGVLIEAFLENFMWGERKKVRCVPYSPFSPSKH